MPVRSMLPAAAVPDNQAVRVVSCGFRVMVPPWPSSVLADRKPFAVRTRLAPGLTVTVSAKSMVPLVVMPAPLFRVSAWFSVTSPDSESCPPSR